MAQVIITIDTENEAFSDGFNGSTEVARILSNLAQDIDQSGDLGDGAYLRDINGNTCGSVQVKG